MSWSRLLAGAALAVAMIPGPSKAAGARLEEVASFPHQVTGVTVSETGRIFVNFPRWSEDVPVSVGEVMRDGSVKAYPDTGWNAWRNVNQDRVKARDHWVCVQSVVADKRGNLWVLDPAAPAMAHIVPDGPKLVQIDLNTNRVAHVFGFDENVAPRSSYLNDVRIAPDGQHAYITDSGAKGALVVVDLIHPSARRVLDGHPSTQPEKGVVIHTDGEELRGADGRSLDAGADGIALSPDGKFLFWQAIKGRTLYRIPTAALDDENLPQQKLAAQIQRIGDNGPSDGLLIDGAGRMYISAIEENAVKLRVNQDVRTLIQDKRLRWPDTFSEGPDGSIYVTTSRIQDSARFKAGAPLQLPTQLWRFRPEPTGRI
jgi:sugar lactone lactonase YvrE